MPELTLVEAVNLALAHELARDPEVVLLGQDIGKAGGVFRATDGLWQRFGAERVIDTPLAESTIVGVSVGMAAQGMRPVAEIQFMGFIFPAFNQIATAVARMRNRTRGRITLPLVIRMPFGGGIHAPEHHSESTEALLAHLPGLKVVIPSTPARAYGLLLAAIRDPDPVIFLEPKRIYRQQREYVEDDGEAYPLEACFVEREGSDVTLVSWGAMMKETREAAERLAQDGISCEVIDVVTVAPLDVATLVESVQKTGRCVVVQEAPRSGGVASEIAAELAEKAILSLIAPIERVTGYDTIMPYPRTEHRYMPTVSRIVEAVQRVMEFH
ncbi:MAG: 2-oxoisovalerate dehydrogenase subunit beta [Gammaproteobacteria bacterium]|nr:MAG: 2-oxoisovalerate dehydrogenase subunit beta [Gammaproteobacteria bacterium]